MEVLLGFLLIAVFLAGVVFLLSLLFRRASKKKILLVVVVCFVVLCIALAWPNNKDSGETGAENQDQTGVTTEDETDLAESEPGQGTVDVAAIQAALETNLAGLFDYTHIEGDETGFTISVANNGVAAEANAALKAGNDETYAPWVSLKSAMQELYSSIYGLLETCGMKDPALMLIILNDQNHDNYLLVMYDNSIVYDVMAG